MLDDLEEFLKDPNKIDQQFELYFWQIAKDERHNFLAALILINQKRPKAAKKIIEIIKFFNDQAKICAPQSEYCFCLQPENFISTIQRLKEEEPETAESIIGSIVENYEKKMHR